MNLNDAGVMIEEQWLQLTKRFKNIALYEFVIMPNHFHGIIKIVGATFMVAQIKESSEKGKEEEGQPQGIAPTESPNGIAPTESPTEPPTNKTIGEIIGAFKSISNNEYIKGVKTNNWQRFKGRLWQRNYWEYIIRNENAYQNISNYIINNPKKWDEDRFNKKLNS